MVDFRNTNSLWASVLVATLARLGLETAVISPGSRSTPLTVALAAHPQVEVLPVLDERSGGFLALGIAQRTGKPVVLVCTSGTAGANYFPAVIEAKESQVPLLVLTADRPPELRDCASGQTIDQQKLFGQFPHAYGELATPVADVGMLCYLRQTVAHFWRCAQTPPGPVHLNCPFRDPLAPVPDGSTVGLEAALGENFFDLVADGNPGTPVAPSALLDSLVEMPAAGLIVVGPHAPRDPHRFCRQVALLARVLGWPVLGEGLSPLRSYAGLNPNLVTTYDRLLRQPRWGTTLAPKQVIQIGPLPTSKVLRQWLAASDPHRWIVHRTYRNLDPLHGRAVFAGSLDSLVHGLEQFSPRSSHYLETWQRLEQQQRQWLDANLERQASLMESKVAWLLARCLPPQTPIFVANSLAVRDVEWFWPPSDRGYELYFNRGANGIDGTLSTALGIAHRHRPAVLLTGDLALLHDTNGFLSVPQLQGHLTVVVVNNRGGGIFERLPIAGFEPPFEALFATPQGVNMPQLCAAYGAEYEGIGAWGQLAQRLSCLPATGVRVLEITCDRKASHRYRQALLEGDGTEA